MAAAQTETTLKAGAISHPLSALLKRPGLETITIPHDPAYGGREYLKDSVRPRIRSPKSIR